MTILCYNKYFPSRSFEKREEVPVYWKNVAYDHVLKTDKFDHSIAAGKGKQYHVIRLAHVSIFSSKLFKSRLLYEEVACFSAC